MKAKDIQPGDKLFDADGGIAYTVVSAEPTDEGVLAVVEYIDGGLGRRVWDDPETDVPLVR